MYTKLECGAMPLRNTSVSITLAFELEVRTITGVRKNYDKDSLI